MDDESVEKLFNNRLVKKINNRNRNKSLLSNSTFDKVSLFTTDNSLIDKSINMARNITNSDKCNYNKMKSFFSDKYKSMNNSTIDNQNNPSLKEDLIKYKGICSKLTLEIKVKLFYKLSY
jgi:hypothetical protein